MKHIFLSLFGVWGLYQGVAYAGGDSDPVSYIGSWTATAYGDFNISDPVANPVVISPYSVNVDISLSADSAHDLDISVANGANNLGTTLDVACPNCIAKLPPPSGPRPWPGVWPEFGADLLHTVVVSEGNVMAMGLVGQDSVLDTGFLYSAWQNMPVSITRDDFIGSWTVTNNYDNYNIRNSDEPFSLEALGTFDITAGSAANSVFLTLTDFGLQIELLVDGNRAFLADAPLDISDAWLLSFDLLHGGDALAVTGIAQEKFDLSDISLSVGTAIPVPLPATLWFFVSALLSLIGVGWRENAGKRRSDS